jgi:hypothetical protein
MHPLDQSSRVQHPTEGRKPYRLETYAVYPHTVAQRRNEGSPNMQSDGDWQHTTRAGMARQTSGAEVLSRAILDPFKGARQERRL